MAHFLKRLNRKAIGYETIDRHISISCPRGEGGGGEHSCKFQIGVGREQS